MSQVDLLAALGLEPCSDEAVEWPDRIGVAELPNGWQQVVWNRDCDAALHPSLADLSRNGEAVACSIEAHVMVFEARGYSGGGEAWRVVRNPEEDFHHLEATGALPPAFAAIREEVFAQQAAEGGEDAGCDFICEAPIRLAESICGFRHDEGEYAYYELRRVKSAGATRMINLSTQLAEARPTAPQGRGFLGWLLGKR